MLVPLSWLKQYIQIDLSPKQIAHLLTMAGVEVADYQEAGANAINLRCWGENLDATLKMILILALLH